MKWYNVILLSLIILFIAGLLWLSFIRAWLFCPIIGEIWIENAPVDPFMEDTKKKCKIVDIKDGHVQYYVIEDDYKSSLSINTFLQLYHKE